MKSNIIIYKEEKDVSRVVKERQNIYWISLGVT